MMYKKSLKIPMGGGGGGGGGGGNQIPEIEEVFVLIRQ